MKYTDEQIEAAAKSLEVYTAPKSEVEFMEYWADRPSASKYAAMLRQLMQERDELRERAAYNQCERCGVKEINLRRRFCDKCRQGGYIC